jgi:hypothetical protein
MSATLTVLISRVRSIVRDSSADFITDVDITQWLNEAMTDIAARQEILDAEQTGTTSTYQITLPPSGTNEVLVIDSLVLGTDGDDVAFVDAETWQSFFDSGADPDYTLGRVYNEKIELYPTPDSGTAYTLRYSYVPAPLSAGGDVHPLPRHLERKMTDYACAYACYKMDDVGRGDRYMSMYEQGLFPVATGRETARPGPITMVPIAGPFDLDVEAMHF